MLRVGIAGCGRVAIGHLAAIQASDKWTLAGIADINPEQREKVRREYGLEHVYGDYRELIDKAQLDALVVSTHLDMHYPIAAAALDAGLHVLCEKPMASSVELCRAMVEKAKTNKRLLAVNFNTRSAPQYRAIKRIIDSGVLGKIRVVRIIFNWSCHQWQPPDRLEHFMAGGGPITDSAVHFFDGVRWFTGSEIRRIDCNGVVLPPYEHPQHGIASCLLEDGGIALVEAGWLYTKRTKDAAFFYQMTVIGDDGVAEHDNVNRILRVWTKTETTETKLTDLEKHFEVVYDAFARSIERDELVELASGYDGLKATEAAFAALASTKRP